MANETAIGLVEKPRAAKRRWRLYCTNSGCGWTSQRRARHAERATANPCPRCGEPVRTAR